MSPQFSLRPRLEPKNKNNPPGPGEYSPTYHQRETSLSYSLGSPAPNKGKKGVPGPGTYESRVSSAPGTKFASSSRMISRMEKVPGPGSYRANSDPTREKTPAYGFGSGPQRNLYIKKPTPGPGAYDGKAVATQLSIKMAARPKDNARVGTVGPGSYEFREHVHRKSPSFSLGTTTRMKHFSPSSPGPG